VISREVSRWGCGDGDSVQYAFLSCERRLYVHNGRSLRAPYETGSAALAGSAAAAAVWSLCCFDVSGL